MNRIKLRQVKKFPSLHDNKNPDLSDENFFYKPYMFGNQIISVIDLLTRLKPKKCFEFGSGFSTTFYSRFIRKAKWISVEHLDVFIRFIASEMSDNIELIHKDIWNGYPEEILNHCSNGLFDFVLIDGERRPECIKYASSCMSDNGIIIQHDTPTDIPIVVDGIDIRSNFSEHGVVNGIWWARK